MAWAGYDLSHAPCHRLAEPGGHGKARKDRTKLRIKYRRTLEDPPGY